MARPRPALTQVGLLRARCRRALSAHRRRARREGKAVPYTADDLAGLALAARLCGYCKAPLSLCDLSFDHQTPVSRGGPWTLDNLSVCCQRCNRIKGVLTVREYLLFRDLLARLHPAAAEDLCRRLLAGGRAAYRREGTP